MARVLVHGHVAEFFPGGQHEHVVTLDRPVPVAQVIASLGVNPMLIMKVFLNGKPATKDDLVGDSDELLLISPASGG